MAAEFILHTGDISHLSKPKEFDTVDQILQSAPTKDVFCVPGEHDVLEGDGKQYRERYGKNTKGAGWYSPILAYRQNVQRRYKEKAMRKSGWIVCIEVSMVLALSALPVAQKSAADPPTADVKIDNFTNDHREGGNTDHLDECR